MKILQLTQGKFAIIDNCDYEKLNQYKWFAVNLAANYWYAVRKIGKWPHQKTVFMHRFILSVPNGFETDHKNHNGLDNRRKNLRICTIAQNSYNRKRYQKGSSKFKNVSLHKRTKKWQSRIYYKGKRIQLNWSDSEIKAAKAYDKTAQRLFGKFACLNFPFKKNGGEVQG